MPKKNNERFCLPLHWAKAFTSNLANVGITPEEAYQFSHYYCLTLEGKKKEEANVKKLIEKSIGLRTFLNSFATEAEVNDTAHDCDVLYNINQWSRNKQVFQFDGDFLEELVETQTIIMHKDMFDYLPYKHFFIDYSGSKKISEELRRKGSFIYIDKDDMGNCLLHIASVSDELYYSDIILVANEDDEIPVEAFKKSEEIEVMTSCDNVRKETFNVRLFRTLILQVVSYLCSIEPDVSESEETKYTYRKPEPKAEPKNKYSEVKKWEVGVRYGNAFRKWKKEHASGGVAGAGTGRGTSKRPHIRKAHWHAYWYGKRGTERIKRSRWVSEVQVNVKLLDRENPELDTVLHKVE